MARKKTEKKQVNTKTVSAEIANAGVIMEQSIPETLEKNYMPYAMSVIVSRAIPEIDGFKPSHRKLLYTMYKMGLLNGGLTKSANIVGQTMRLNPHGDQAIYETMVRLARGNEALLHPYVQSKGNFGKAYSRDMAYAASRYTEAKLDKICNELFCDIDKDTVDFVDNYDGTMKEPTLFPATFPTVLVNANMGIAVGMASSICPFNLEELCDTTIELMRDKNHNALTTLKAPDFPGGGLIVYDQTELEKIYSTGRGSVKVRSVYNYDKESNCVEVTQIPYSTSIEAIIEKIVELVKDNKIKEVSDIRDETDLSGLKITIDLKRGTDPDRLMQKLFKMTPLEDNFSCNFNVLIGGNPRVMGVYELLDEWIAFRKECVRRRIYCEMNKKKDKLHLLKGLQKILLDIDKAIKIVRETDEEAEVVPNLMIGFGIDEIQAEYVAEIKLRHLNREYILNRTSEIEKLKKEIAEMEDILNSPKKVRDIIISELKEVKAKYGMPRKSLIYYPSDEIEIEEEKEEVPDYPVTLFFTKEGYFKKITPNSLRLSGEHKLKEGDTITQTVETTNGAELLFFTNKCQVYKSRANDFSDTKASVIGDFVSAKLSMDDGEVPIFMAVTKDYSGNMLFLFKNGKGAKVSLSAYQTKTNRKKLINAYSDKSEISNIFQLTQEQELAIFTSAGRMLCLNTAMINAKTTKDSQGVGVITLKKNQSIERVENFNETKYTNPSRYKTKSLPATGAILKTEDIGEQIEF